MGGLVERIGDVDNSTLITKGPMGAAGEIKKLEAKVAAADHVSAMSYVLDFLTDNVSKRVKDEVAAVGHRCVCNSQRLCTAALRCTGR
jgi:acetate kinase